MCADDEWEVDDRRAGRHGRRVLLRPLPRPARERARHARRPLPVRPFRGAAPAPGVGPHRRHHPRPQGRSPAGRHQRRDDPRPRPLRRPPARRPARRRARRGDGLRGAPGADVPAGRDDLENRGHHPRPGDRHARAGRSRRGSVLEGRRHRPARRVGPGDRRLRPRGGRATKPERARAAITTSTAAPPKTSSPTCASSRRRPGSCPPTKRSSSSAFATRSATGACASSRRSAGASTPPGGWRCRARIREERDLEADAIWSDDGIVVHLPDADEPPPADLVLIEPDEVEDLVVAELSGSALFGARFRENASRSLLIPRAYPGKRTPLWQQRLRAQSLLEVAKDFPRFPVILETYRECLRDVLDVPALQTLLRDLHSRKISLVEVETPTASPFASSLLFDYVATYMYEGDTPNAERRAAALALDRDLLRELLGQEELRELIDPEALDDVEESLQHRKVEARAADRDALQQILRRLGDLTLAECEERTAAGYSAESMLGKLESERRAARVRIAGEERWIAGEDAGMYRDALGVPPPPGLPESYLEDVESPLADLMRRYARTHGPFPTARPAERYGVDPSSALRELEREGALVRGELLPGGSGREWCDAEVLRRVRRASLAHLRKEAEAVDQVELARFLPQWQNVDAHRSAGAGPDRLREALVALQGVAVTPEVWERDVLPRRLGAYSPTWLDQLSTAGELVWVGAGALGPAAAGGDLLSRGRPPRRAAARQRQARRAGGRDPRRNPRAARCRAPASGWTSWRNWSRPRRSSTPRSGTSPGRGRSPTTPSLPFARGVCARCSARRPRRPALRVAARRGRRGGSGPLVADRPPVRRRAGDWPAPARPGGADARAPRHRHPRVRPGRGRSRRFLQPLRRAVEPRGARHGAPRLLRRGARGRAVRAVGRDRAAALAAASRRASNSSWRRPTRRIPTGRRCRGRSARAAGGPVAPRAPSSSRATACRCSSSSAAAAGFCALPSWRARSGGGGRRAG